MKFSLRVEEARRLKLDAIAIVHHEISDKARSDKEIILSGPIDAHASAAVKALLSFFLDRTEENKRRAVEALGNIPAEEM